MKIYVATIILTCLSMLVLAIFAMNNDAITKPTKRGFVLSAALIAVSAAAECGGEFLNGASADLRWLHSVIKFLELSAAPFIPVVLSSAFYPIKYRKIVFGLLLTNVLIEFLSIFFGITFFVDENNFYVHRTFYPVYYVAIALGTAFLIVTALKFLKYYQNYNLSTLIAITVFASAGIITQIIDSEIKIVWLTIAAGFTLFYIYYGSIILRTNALTGLLNRRSFESRIKSDKRRIGIAFFDVNDFKSINDTHGHGYGDHCLETVGEAIKTIYGKAGRCYRVGGDEFCVIFKSNAFDIEELNAAFSEYLNDKRTTDRFLPTVAVGYAVFDPQTDDMAQVLENADKQMYLAKNQFKNE